MEQSQELAEQYPAVIEAKKEFEKINKEAKLHNAGRYPKQVARAVKRAKTKLKKVKLQTKLDIRKQRVEVFMAALLKNGGDPTAAAKTAFSPTSHIQAVKLGYDMMKESKLFGRTLLTSKGITYGKLLDIAIDRAYTSKKVDWFDRLMKIGEFHDFLPRGQSQGPTVVNIVGSTKDDAKTFGFSQEVIEGEIANGK